MEKKKQVRPPNYPLRLDKNFMDNLKELAKQEGRSLNNLIARILEQNTNFKK